MADLIEFDLITEDWLKSVGFRWHQLDRQPDKHWLLWLGDAIGDRLTSYEDLGIELAPVARGPDWFCWLRSDCSHRYSRFLHVRHIAYQTDLIKLIEALTGRKWEPANNLYGSMRRPEQAARIRQDDERLDRRLMRNTPWRDSEKDESMGGALPEHLEAHELARSTKEPG